MSLVPSRKPYAIGGEVLPDVLSAVGDVVGTFFGDPGAGDQGVGMLSKLDGGKTGGQGVESQAFGDLTNTENSGGNGLNGTGSAGMTGANAAMNFLRKGGPARQGFDNGGSAWGTSGDESSFHGSGLFNSLGSGRTDIHNRDVPPNGFVVPADVVSGLAEGNTLGGSAVINRMMKAGPYNTTPGVGEGGTKGSRGHSDIPRAQPPKIQQQPQQGGMGVESNASGGLTGRKKETGNVPVVVAGGEHYIHPDDITKKFGSLERGHQILRQWVLSRRQKNIKELKKLPPPKK